MSFSFHCFFLIVWICPPPGQNIEKKFHFVHKFAMNIETVQCFFFSFGSKYYIFNWSANKNRSINNPMRNSFRRYFESIFMHRSLKLNSKIKLYIRRLCVDRERERVPWQHFHELKKNLFSFLVCSRWTKSVIIFVNRVREKERESEEL